MSKEQLVETKDEIIQELWKIKEHFSCSCNKNIRQLIQLVNTIAKQQGFENTVSNKISSVGDKEMAQLDNSSIINDITDE
jgi:hypothetical protein